MDRIRVEFLGVLNGLFDGFAGFARKPNNEGAMNDNTQFVAIAGELFGGVVVAGAVFDPAGLRMRCRG